MFRPNALKRRLREGQRALGCWTVLGSPPVIELLAYCGFDYLLLDQEHGFGDASALLHSLQAMAATRTAPRSCACHRTTRLFERVLDAGVEGVMVPNIETADEARPWWRLPLTRRRGGAARQLGSARASDYGIHAPDYRKNAAEEPSSSARSNRPRAVDNIDAITAVDGLDVLFIGAHDLSGTVGQLGD